MASLRLYHALRRRPTPRPPPDPGPVATALLAVAAVVAAWLLTCVLLGLA